MTQYIVTYAEKGGKPILMMNEDIDELIDRVSNQKNYPPCHSDRLDYDDGYRFGLLVAVEVIKKWAGVWNENTQ